jgi:N-acetyl-anhydromuramyl-L-alanine amidase AmpD
MIRMLICCGLLSVAGCASQRMVDIPSENHNSRIQYLVIHFTSENFSESLRLLTTRTENPVSVHYLVPEPGDDTYNRNSLSIHRLVPESRRAWHAGTSYWGRADALNDTSIGIEIVNQSACINNDPETEFPTPEDQVCRFLEYPEAQLQLVVELASDILERNPEIDPVDVIGHGDIAADRRVDPGPRFPWKRLYDNGIGAWYDDEAVAAYKERFDRVLPDMFSVQEALKRYGYQIGATGENDVQTRFVVRSLQMHFRPSDTSGQMDAETAAILFALNDKYRTPEPGM